MRVRRPAALAALTILAILPVLGSQVLASGPSPEAARAAAEHARIVAYWTPARMKAAIPRDFAFDPSTGRFHLAPLAKPGGISGNGNTTGSSWPNGKGKVYSATGKVYFEMGGGAWICSGTAISDKGGTYSVVLTAGHCVYDEENGNGSLAGFATNWMFIPEFDSKPTYTCSDTAFGCWTARALVARREFATAGGFTTTATHYDWGFAVVGGGGLSGSAQLDATVGTFGTTFANMTGNTIVDAFGYPAAQKYHGSDLVYCQGPIGFDSLAGNGTYKLACGMTGGSSGGPWFSGFTQPDGSSTGDAGSVQSLNSYGYSGQSNMYGPKFNSDTQATYTVANNGATSNTLVP
jgi:V8-like Glu-specific endopeptidase